MGECEYCGSHNVSLISPRTLGEYMCSCLEKAYEYIDEGTGATMYDSEDEMYLGPDGKEATVYSVREILMEEEVFADITDSDALLDELFLGLLSYEEQKDGAYNPFYDIDIECFVVKDDLYGLEATQICKVFVVRYLVFVGFGMYNKFCIYRGKSWKYQMRKTDITICE